MDELDLIRELCDEQPDAAARARARRDLDQHVRAAQMRSAPRRPRRWTVAASGVAGAVAIAVVIALVTGVDDAAIAPAPATAKQALERAATAAERQPERPLGRGEYFYVRERAAYLTTTAGEGAGWSALVPTERETWTARSGAGRFRSRDVGRPSFPGPRDRARWQAAGRPSLVRSSGPAAGMRLGANGFPSGGTSLTYEQLAALPTDGEAMYRKLIELAGGAGPSPDEEAFTIIGDLLRSAPVPAPVRAALYRAAAHIKGVRYVGAVRDELGRRGLAVELTRQHQRRRLVFDPATAQVLVEQDVLTERVPYIDADPGFVTGYRIVLEQGVVTSDTTRP